MKIDLFYEIVSQCMINGVRLAAAFFLYRLLSDFVNKKRAFASAVLYLAVLTVLYYIPQILPNLAAYVIAMAAVYIVLIVGDFKKIRLKAFLCITFFALRWLAVGSVSQLMMLINQMTTTLMNNIEIYMTNIPAIIAMFVATEILEVVLCMLFIGFSVKMFLKVYKNVCEELTVKEFIMLVLPMLAQVVGYQSVINYYDLYDKAMKAGVIEPVYEFNYILLAFYLISYGAILVFLMLYQELKKMQENNKEQEILEAQIDNLKNHIDTAMKSYAEIRAMRHDMANHLMVLNELIESGRNEAADLGAVGNAPIWLLAGFVILLIHVAIMIALAKILKLDIFTCCVASLANIGGTATAPVLAGAYSNALVPVGIMMALLGYVVGTGGGLVVANLMSIFG